MTAVNPPILDTAAPQHAAPAFPGRPRETSAWLSRLPGAALFLAALSVLLVAAALDADPAGLGTHTQLGFAPCGFVGASGLPCATCGMTTATTLAADGRLLAAFRVQPAGALFALLLAVLVIVGGWSACTGRSLRPLAEPLGRARFWLAVGAVVALAWGYRVAEALGGYDWTAL